MSTQVLKRNLCITYIHVCPLLIDPFNKHELGASCGKYPTDLSNYVSMDPIHICMIVYQRLHQIFMQLYIHQSIYVSKTKDTVVVQITIYAQLFYPYITGSVCT